jgi:dTDP-4-dehydrorhamnose reductase
LLGGEVVRQATQLLGAGLSAVWGAWHSHPCVFAKAQTCALDLADRTAVLRLVEQIQPDTIVHTAYRKEGVQAYAITAEGTAAVAEAAAACGARLVHVSSDVIFDGAHAPYDETALPAPIHAYGAAKAAAEAAVKRLAPGAVIVRTSLICRLEPADRITAWVVDSLRNDRPITLFTDEIRSPVWVDDLAAALIELVFDDFAGVINVAGPQALSRYAMGERLAQRFGLDARKIIGAPSAASGLARPRNCTLDVRLAQRLLHTRLRGYDEGLDEEMMAFNLPRTA